MSWQAVRWVLSYSPTKRTDRLVLLSLAEHANDDGTNAWPSYRTIAHEANIKEGSVRAVMRRLQKDGAVVQTQEARQHTPAHYDVVMTPEIARGRQPVPPDEMSRGSQPAPPDGPDPAGQYTQTPLARGVNLPEPPERRGQTDMSRSPEKFGDGDGRDDDRLAGADDADVGNNDATFAIDPVVDDLELNNDDDNTNNDQGKTWNRLADTPRPLSASSPAATPLVTIGASPPASSTGSATGICSSPKAGAASLKTTDPAGSTTSSASPPATAPRDRRRCAFCGVEASAGISYIKRLGRWACWDRCYFDHINDPT